MMELTQSDLEEKVRELELVDVEIIGWRRVTEGSCFVVRAVFRDSRYIDLCYSDDLYDRDFWLREIKSFLSDLAEKGRSAWTDHAVSTLESNIY